MRGIGHQVHQVAAVGNFLQGVGEGVPFRGPHRRKVQSEIDPAPVSAGRYLAHISADPAADKGAAANFSVDQAAPGGFGIGARYRADSDTELIGQLAVSRQLRARLQGAGGDVFRHGAGDREIFRSGPVAQIGDPVHRVAVHTLSL